MKDSYSSHFVGSLESYLTSKNSSSLEKVVIERNYLPRTKKLLDVVQWVNFIQYSATIAQCHVDAKYVEYDGKFLQPCASNLKELHFSPTSASRDPTLVDFFQLIRCTPNMEVVRMEDIGSPLPFNGNLNQIDELV